MMDPLPLMRVEPGHYRCWVGWPDVHGLRSH